MRTRVKICGITRVEDALAAAQLGADAIGLVFYEGSPRHVTVDQARNITRALPPFVTRVGLFVDVVDEQVGAAMEGAGLEVLQFHGEAPADRYSAFGRPYIKAIPMTEGIDVYAQQRNYPDAMGFLLDTHMPGIPGGSGTTFDWDRVPQDLKKPVILAGGLDSANVRAAILKVRPFAVDVSSGVEKEKGIKDIEKMSAFIASVRTCQ